MISILAALVCAAPAEGKGELFLGGAYGGEVAGLGPGGEQFNYAVLGVENPVVERISTADGSIDQYRELDDFWALPAVTVRGEGGGLSADGGTLVLIEPYAGPETDRTRFRILDTRTLKPSDRLSLDGLYSFDAISPDGELIYLVEYRDPRNPLDYRVRAYDLVRERFRPGAIIDPDEPEEAMSGQPVSREASPDGRWAYTLYGGGEETFIHALDTVGATAVCVDLEEIDPRFYFDLRLRTEPSTGALTVTDKGVPAATVDPETFEVGPPAAVAASGEAGAEASRSGWVGPAAVAGGVVLAIAACAFALRRRRAA